VEVSVRVLETTRANRNGLPRKGTVLRYAWDAAHAYWCGPNCEPNCRQWSPNRKEIEAIVMATRRFDYAKKYGKAEP
jgi:hypothetical protein